MPTAKRAHMRLQDMPGGDLAAELWLVNFAVMLASQGG
jgi:hypothetical protein